MRAVVLVGGEGTRLRPLTLSTPKQMLPVVEYTMVERVLSHLASYEVDEVVLSLGYQPDVFTARFPDARIAGVHVTYAVEPQPLDTAGAIRFAALAAGIDQTFVAMNGDVLVDLDVGRLVEFHRSKGAEATIHLVPVEDPSAFGVVVTNHHGLVEEFVEKPAPGRAPSNLINAGTYVLEPTMLEAIPGDRRVSIERETFPVLAKQEALFALASDVYWLDAGTPAKYLRAQMDLLSGARPGPPAPHARAVRPGVWLIGDPKVEGDVAPPSLAGDGAVVAKGARVAGSVVGAHAVVETGAWVINSVLLPGSVVGAGSRIEQSIIGEGAVIGEEAMVQGSVLGGGAEVGDGHRISDERVPDDEGRGSPELVG